MTEEAVAADVTPEATPDAPQESQSLVGDVQEQAGWFYDENMAGIGNKPEFLKDNFKTVSEQARAYTELEKKFGSFKGQPKDGYSLPDDMSGDDALVAEVIKFGQTHNMSQDGFDEMLNLAMTQANVTEEVSREQEMSKLGADASKRISRVDGFLRNNLEADEYDKIAPMLTTASHVELTEALISMTSQESLPVEDIVTPSGVTFDQYMSEYLKKDENGNTLYSINSSHKNKCDRMRAELEAMEKKR